MKKLLTMLICLSLLIGLLPQIALPTVATFAEDFELQSVDTVEIWTPAELIAIGDDLSGNYSLMCDLDVSGYNWHPIGTSAEPFCGSFSGNGHTIFGLTIDESNPLSDRFGLFGSISGATIKDLSLSNVKIIITGAPAASGIIHVGCIAGYANNTTIDNCTAQSEIQVTTSQRFHLANFVGTLGDGETTIRLCNGYGSITGDTTASGVIGGIVAYSNPKNNSVIELSCCANHASLSSKTRGQAHCGGIIGYQSPYYSSVFTTARSCNKGSVYAYTSSSSDYTYAGGIVGYCDAFESASSYITDCYNAGTIFGNKHAGGICQRAFLYRSGNYAVGKAVVFSNCYNVGQVSGGGTIKPIVSRNESCTISNCYYLNTTGSDSNGTALSSAQMQVASNFSGFDFINIWEFGGGEEYPYPTLRYEANDGCRHVWGNAYVTKVATCTECGQVIYTCTICDETRTLSRDPLGHNFVDGVCTRCGLNSLTTITIKYVPSDGGKAVTSLDFDYSDTYFNGSAYSYNHDLAKISLGLTMATSCKSIVNGHLMGDIYLRDSLTQIGCDPQNFYSKKFDNNTATDDTSAYIFGTKYIPEQNAYLIPVVIRSANYGGEWASNVHVSEGHIATCSYGFKAAADALYEDLQSYVAPLLPDNSSLNPGQVSPKIVYWVTGFSRGGAIANLLGARLTAASNGGGSSIFVYSFATPETVKSSAYVNYKNIHNIVSEIDVVPRVPLEAWSYTRYGTTHYLPCHTTRGVRYDTLLSGMQYEFNRLMTNNGCSYRNNPFYGQEIAIDLLLEYLADLAPSTDEYEDGKLQALIRGFLIQKQGNCTLEDIIYFLLEGHETEAAMLVHIISSIDDATTMQKFGYYQLAVNEILAAMLTGEDTDAETVLKGRILKVLIELLIRYDARGYAGIVFGSDCFDNYACAVLMIEDLFDNGLHSALLMQHWPETYLAWLNSSNPNNLFSDCAYRRVSVKCPVDLVVYDSGDNVVARVQNDLVDTSVEHSLLVVVNGNGEKDIFLPEDEAYTVVITSRENGQLDIVETSFDLEHQLTGTACYFNLEMKENQTFLAEIDPDKEDIKVESLDNEIVADYSSEEPDKVQISITSVAPALTYGSGEYYVGETVCLAASDSHTYLFEGWYCNGNFITSEREIYFSAVDNREYTAVFHEHDWNEPEYVWADDYSTITATHVCKNDAGHIECETVHTTSEITKPATCTGMGEKTYTAVFENIAFAEQTKIVANIEMLDHSPGEPVKENDLAPTCEVAGGYDMVIYCTACGAEISRKHTDVSALGHNYELTGWTWTGFTAASATFTCKNDASHVEKVDATITSVRTEPTADQSGSVVYTAKVTFEESEYTDTKTDILPALGHDYEPSGWNWTGYTAAAATFTDKNGGDPITVDATITSERTEPTCTEEGKVVYTATVTFEGNEYSDAKTETLTAIGHDWNEPDYLWADDYSTVTATRTCKNDASHLETETVDTTSEVAKPATYDEEGEIVYTATFENEAFTTQTKSVATPKLEKPDDPNPGLPCDGGDDCPGNVFTDMPAKGNWAHDAIDWAIVTGVTSGTSETTFSPNAGCTRAQVVTFLWRAAGSPEPTSTSNPFTDVTGGYYYKAVLWAVEKNITSGTSATSFSPNATCTRAQIVTFLWRFEGSPAPKATNNPFTDVKPGSYYEKAVLWASESGVTTGTSATTFSPNATCTRAQIVTFLYRDLVS